MFTSVASGSPRPLLALFGSRDPARPGLLLSVDRTCGGHHETDAFDPVRTWRNRLFDPFVGAGDDRRREGEDEPLNGTRDQDTIIYGSAYLGLSPGQSG